MKTNNITLMYQFGKIGRENLERQAVTVREEPQKKYTDTRTHVTPWYAHTYTCKNSNENLKMDGFNQPDKNNLFKGL